MLKLSRFVLCLVLLAGLLGGPRSSHAEDFAACAVAGTVKPCPAGVKLKTGQVLNTAAVPWASAPAATIPNAALVTTPPALSATTPTADSVSAGAVGTGTTAARQDHVHLIPTGTSSSTVAIGNDARICPVSTGAGDTFYGTGSACAILTAGSTHRLMHSNGASATTWGQVDLATEVTGLLPNANLANPSFTLNASAGVTASTSTVSLGGTVAISADTAVVATTTNTLAMSNKTLTSPTESGTVGGTRTIGGTPTLGVNLAAGGFKVTGLGTPTAASSDAATASYAEAQKTGSVVVLATVAQNILANTFCGINVGYICDVAANVPPVPFGAAGVIKNCTLQGTGSAAGSATNVTLYKATGATNTPSYSAQTLVLAVGNGNNFGSDTNPAHSVSISQFDLGLWKVDQAWSGARFNVSCQFIPN